jgi:hypothetical protein
MSRKEYHLLFLKYKIRPEVIRTALLLGTKLRVDRARYVCERDFGRRQTASGDPFQSGCVVEPAKAQHGVSIQTTEHYLGCKQKLRFAVNDKIGIEP